MSNIISFPGLGISFDPPRTAFTLLGFDVKWYGVIIAVGFILALAYTLKRSEKFGFSQDSFIDILFVAVPVGIICARLYYVIFNFELFRGDPLKVIRVWEGGLAIYGGVIGGMLSAIIVAKIKKINPLAVADLGALGFLIGQAVGRWGNFINREAYGSVTTSFLRMEIYDAAAGMRISVHPCFLYESVWNLAGFVLLHFLSRRRRYDGQILLGYLAWYGLGRFFIEGLRTDSLYFFSTGIRVSQMLAILSMLAAILIMVYIRFLRKKELPVMQSEVYQRQLAAQAIADAAKTAGKAAGKADSFPIETFPTVEAAEDVVVSSEDMPNSSEENKNDESDV